MTNEQVITRIKHNSMYKDDRETADYIIKALEQQPSEDCVSREQLIAKLKAWDNKANAIPLYAWRVIKDLPPVTPTHGTCKDCKHCGAYLCGYTCYKGHWGKISKESNYGGMGDWYCKDFERKN